MALPKDGRKRELLEGRIHMSPVGYTHGLICRRIFMALALHVEKQGLGDVLDSSMGYRLGGTGARGTVLSPDVSFVAAARLAKILPDPNKFIQAAPDLAVEVLSPGDSSLVAERKTRKYFEHGAQAVWIVDPYLREVRVFTGKDAKRVYRDDDIIEGAPAVPGFRLPVVKIFE